MDVTFEQIAKEATRLGPAERAELADILVESLETSEPDEVQRLWIETAAKRLSEMRLGEVKTIPGEEVMAEAPRLANR